MFGKKNEHEYSLFLQKTRISEHELLSTSYVAANRGERPTVATSNTLAAVRHFVAFLNRPLYLDGYGWRMDVWDV